jgi:hypothetical protein
MVKAMGTPDKRAELLDLALFASKTLRPKATTPTSLNKLTAVLEMCLTQLITSFRFDFGSDDPKKRNNGTAAVAGVELLQLCYTLQLPSFVDRVLARFTVVPQKQSEETFIKRGLIPIVKALPKLLQNQQLSMVDAPFSQFASTVTQKLVRQLMGSKPAFDNAVLVSELKTLSSVCCSVCDTHLRPFLATTRLTISVSAVGQVRLHLEQRLSLFGVNLKGSAASQFTGETIKVGKPHTLKVWSGVQSLISFVDESIGRSRNPKV